MSRSIGDGDSAKSLDAAGRETRFATAVAAYGLRLRGKAATGDFDFGAISELASTARGPDVDGTRAEFIRLARTAETLEKTTWRP